jgi:hypothetical protein
VCDGVSGGSLSRRSLWLPTGIRTGIARAGVRLGCWLAAPMPEPRCGPASRFRHVGVAQQEPLNRAVLPADGRIPPLRCAADQTNAPNLSEQSGAFLRPRAECEADDRPRSRQRWAYPIDQCDIRAKVRRSLLDSVQVDTHATYLRTDAAGELELSRLRERLRLIGMIEWRIREPQFTRQSRP